MKYFTARLRNWGAFSKGIVIPKKVVDNLAYRDNTIFKISIRNRTLILEPMSTPKSSYKIPSNFNFSGVAGKDND